MDMKAVYAAVLVQCYQQYETLDAALLYIKQEFNLNGKITIYSCRLYDNEQAKIIRYFNTKDILK
jgi:hypothetical protein